MTKHAAQGPGRAGIKRDRSVLFVWLSNFDINSSVLKQEHIDALRDAVVPVIRNGGTINLMGLASTTGTLEHNRKLAIARIEAVIAQLRILTAGGTFRVGRTSPIGEIMPLAFKAGEKAGKQGLQGGTEDNVESKDWRGVVINATNSRFQPTPMPSRPLGAPSAAPGEWIETVSQAMDVAGAALGWVDLGAEIAGVTAAWATAVTVGGLALGAISSMAAMPLVFISADSKAKWNGTVQGMADALQDCADQFNSSNLDTLPLSKWPTIKAPEIRKPHGKTSNGVPTASETAWKMGQIEGRNRIVKDLVEMERFPRLTDPTTDKAVKVSGRIWLRLVHLMHKDRVGVELVIKPVNARLAAQGLKPWPTI